MKILFVTNNYTPYSGGVVSSIESFRHELIRQGHTVIVATLDFEGSPLHEESIIRLYCPVRFSYKSNPMAVPVFATKQLRDICTSFKPDIIHTHHPFLLGQAARKVAFELKIPLVFTHHSQYEQYVLHYAPFFTNYLQDVVDRYVTSFCKQIDHIIAPTTSVAEQLNKKGISTRKSVISSGPLSIFETVVYTPKKKQRVFKLLVVSRFAAEKNIFFLLDVIKELGNMFTLTLIGYGPLYNELCNYAYNVLSLSHEQVIFIIHPPKSVIAQAYLDADLFIFSSETETQGIVFAESMMAGTPIVALKAPGAQDCIYDTINGFLVSCKEDMIEKINYIANNSILHEQLQKGAWLEGKKYSRINTTQQLIAVYESVL